jgi:hypothetical protein
MIVVEMRREVNSLPGIEILPCPLQCFLVRNLTIFAEKDARPELL